MPRQTRDWIDAFLTYTDNEEPPKVFQKWSAISAISAALQRKCWIRRGKLLWYPNTYVFLVGPSSIRKGTSMEAVMGLLESLSGEIVFTPARVTDAEIIRTLDSARKSITMPDGTIYEHCSMTIFSQELTVLLRSSSEDMIEILTDWYDCRGKWENKTKTSGNDILTNVFVSFIGATTPKKFACLPKVQAEGGLFARSVIVFSDKTHCWNPCPELTNDHIKLYEALKSDLQHICTMRGEFKQEQDAVDAYNDWYIRESNNPPFTDELLGPYSARRGMICSKISMIMSASRSDERVIRLPDFERAVAFLEEVEKSMQYAFGGVGNNKMAFIQSQIERLVMESSVPLSVAGLMRHFKSDVSHNDMASILITLKESGIIVFETSEDGKRFIKRR